MNNMQELIEKIGLDKIAHAAVSCCVVLALFVLGAPPAFGHPLWLVFAVSVLASAATGVLKEVIWQKIYDIPLDWKDIAANGVGIAIGAVVSLLYILN